MKKEILDLINEKDEVIGQESYDVIHKDKLLHRVTSAMLFNNAGEVLLQLRAKEKSAYPLHWSFSMGGHVRHNETYLNGLVREAEEEVGVVFLPSDFVFKGKGKFVEKAGAPVLYQIYTTIYDGPIEERNEEVEAVQFVSPEVLKKMLEDRKEKIHPAMATVLRAHWSEIFAQ